MLLTERKKKKNISIEIAKIKKQIWEKVYFETLKVSKGDWAVSWAAYAADKAVESLE